MVGNKTHLKNRYIEQSRTEKRWAIKQKSDVQEIRVSNFRRTNQNKNINKNHVKEKLCCLKKLIRLKQTTEKLKKMKNCKNPQRPRECRRYLLGREHG
jgi:phosphohistidine phosphatase SixA